MACLKDAITQTLQHGYAHHIQRLMVTGLYALLLGVRPQAVHAWYLSVYVDAVEWVELPNTLGMGKHCKGCRFDPAQATAPQACPFTTLYWDFLARHETLLNKEPRHGAV